MKKGKWLVLAAAIMILGTVSFTVSAAEDEPVTDKWMQNDVGWWYQKADGSYPRDCWQLIDGEYYYFNSYGYRLENAWKGNYYLGENGVMATNRWVGPYYVGADGAMLRNAWVEEGKYYVGSNGAYVTKWLYLDGWYYFGPNGEKQTGWKWVNGYWYYLDDTGKMATGWLLLDGYWYYLRTGGAMATGWARVGGNWYYLKNNGVMATGWQAVNGYWYYLKDSGAMATNWLLLDGDWYYLRAGGAMATGWVRHCERWYYLNIYGRMLKGWQYVNGYKYYFNPGGDMCLDLRDKVSGPYLLKVNRQQNCVTAYARDGGNGFIIPVKAFACSTGGYQTPLGTFTMSTQYRWHQLFGAVGQYCSVITGDILFHSVPYYKFYDHHSLMPGQFNRLGSDASAGCVRLSTGDAKWVYDNCSAGSTTVIIYDSAVPTPLEKPVLPKIPYYQNWDPTDPEVR